MQLFAEYVQPLTVWIHANPEWALTISFLISFAESLAIVGSIVPGSVTMTTIGILAGSGIMRIDLTLIAAMLGAVVGDSVSYFLGYYLKDNLENRWPFKRYPHWLLMGQDYFARHGGKSVIIGRFIGPLRAIIPVIAGMMRMPQLKFITANVISAIGWSILYVGPGILIGAASNELSAENATRLFLFILAVLICLWLFSLLIKWLFIRTSRLLSTNLNGFWQWLKKHPTLSSVFLFLTPANEKNHYPTAAFVLSSLLILIAFVLLFTFTLHKEWLVDLNQSISLFLQSIRTDQTDVICFFTIQLVSLPILILVTFSIAVIFLWDKYYREASYLICSVITAFLLSKGIHLLLNYVRYPDINFPQTNLTTATALYLFLVFYSRYVKQSLRIKILKTLLLSSLLTASIAFLYVGSAWLSDILGSLLSGAFIALWSWLFYRRIKIPTAEKTFPSLLISCILILSSMVSFFWHYESLMERHDFVQPKQTISSKQWWSSDGFILPVYRYNRIGQIAGIFNIQYRGPLKRLKKALKSKGWRQYNESLLTSLLKRMTAQSRENALPLLTQLHNNKKPELIMTYQDKTNQNLFVFRLWLSHYYLNDLNHPIWIGSVHVNNQRKWLQKHRAKINGLAKKPLELIRLNNNNFVLKERTMKIPGLSADWITMDKSILLIKKSGN